MLALLLVAASCLGCGGGPGDADEITQLTKQLAADVRDKNWNGVCDASSAKARAEFAAGSAVVGGEGCAAVIARVYALDDDPEVLREDVKVSDIKITGDRATAEVTPSFPGQAPTLRYVREDGEWKVDSDTGG